MARSLNPVKTEYGITAQCSRLFLKGKKIFT